MRLFVGQTVDELIAVLTADSISISYEDARAVVVGQQADRTPVQRLVHNIVDILYDMDDISAGEVDEGVIFDLLRRMTYRVDVASFRTSPIHMKDRRVAPWEGVELPYGKAIAVAVDLANGTGVSPAEHPLLLALGIDDAFVQSAPFEALNSTISWLLGRIVMTKRGLHALGYVPIHHCLTRWKHDLVRPASNGLLQSESIITVGDTVDFTGYVAGIIELVASEAFALERLGQSIIEREAGVGQLLLGNSLINHRQRALIQEALRNPAAAFKIAAHQKAQHIAYATARADLYGLEDLGLFDRRQEGHAFVFVPRPDLAEVVLARP